MNDGSSLSDAELLALAPYPLAQLRASRYLGDDVSVTLGDFGPDDRALARELYAALRGLLDILRANLDTPAEGLGLALEFARRNDWTTFIGRVRELGRDTPRLPEPGAIDRVIHDLRGGAFQALSIQLQLIGLGVTQADDVARMFFLARDQLKIMRSAVRDIDPAGYERDRAERLHGARLLIEKWDGAVHRAGERAARVAVDCRFDGNVSERCLEFAALDRVLYNLLNNAVRHSADGRVYLTILPVPPRSDRPTPDDSAPADLRFVIANAIAGSQRSAIEERYRGRVSDLFRGGFTTGGTGLGMRICADFVANAYGLDTYDPAIAGRYIGAELLGPSFVSWFHWPIAAD